MAIQSAAALPLVRDSLASMSPSCPASLGRVVVVVEEEVSQG